MTMLKIPKIERWKTQARRIRSDTFQSLLLMRAKRLNRRLVRLDRLVSEKMAHHFQ